MVKHTLDQFFLQKLCKMRCQYKTCYSVPGSSLLLVCDFVSFGVCANANLIVIILKEQRALFIQLEQLPGAVLLQNLVLKTRLLRSRPSLFKNSDDDQKFDHTGNRSFSIDR